LAVPAEANTEVSSIIKIKQVDASAIPLVNLKDKGTES
jgi:hypothetical protein